MRSAWLPWGLVLLAVAGAAPIACGQAFQTSGGSGTTSVTSGGGSTATAAGTDGASTGTGGAEASGTTSGAQACLLAKDCPGVDSVCGTRTCDNGTCEVTKADPGLTASQIYGD